MVSSDRMMERFLVNLVLKGLQTILIFINRK